MEGGKGADGVYFALISGTQCLYKRQIIIKMKPEEPTLACVCCAVFTDDIWRSNVEESCVVEEQRQAGRQCCC